MEGAEADIQEQSPKILAHLRLFEQYSPQHAIDLEHTSWWSPKL